MSSHVWLNRSLAQSTISPDYAESCAVVGLNEDGSREISLRLARFPAKNEGTLWVTACSNKDVWCAVVEGIPLGTPTERTMVETPKVRFELTGKNHGWMTRTSKDSLQGAGKFTVGAHLSTMPSPGSGPFPLVVEARFESRHRPVNVRPGRIEVMGRTLATVRTPASSLKFQGVGKWHEQVGDRPRFAPAFTYMSVMNEHSGLLATKIQNGAFGYAWMDKEIVMVKAMEIDPISQKRSFRVTLEDGRVIAGEAVTHRVITLPIEGQHRPGATVTVKSDLGAMIGHLNDWQPEKT
ncbi:MAG TPA: hypothetical protein VFZ34_10500 [Blastocatellia bacterium]|nr:hypothetical protein [Blastocatellia bacterium]